MEIEERREKLRRQHTHVGRQAACRMKGPEEKGVRGKNQRESI